MKIGLELVLHLTELNHIHERFLGVTEVAGGSGIVQQRGRSSLRKLARVWDLMPVVWFLADGGRMFSQVRVVCIEGVRVGGLTSPKLERVWVRRRWACQR